MKQGYFITGTDTNAGKTWATLTLMQYFKNQGKSVVAMKPVASGCEWSNDESSTKPQRKNQDALLLQAHASIVAPYDLINPYAYEKPISPHLAGVDNPVQINQIVQNFNVLKELADILLVEGAGGWYAPVNAEQSINDLAAELGLPVILVVAIRLGCINHAKLSYEAINRSGLPCTGWIASCVEPDMPFCMENISTIKSALGSPLLGVLPYCKQADFGFFAGQLTI